MGVFDGLRDFETLRDFDPLLDLETLRDFDRLPLRREAFDGLRLPDFERAVNGNVLNIAAVKMFFNLPEPLRDLTFEALPLRDLDFFPRGLRLPDFE